MPEGERAFATSQGPRKVVTVRISAEAYVLAKVAGATFGRTPHGQLTDVIEKWAADFLEQNAEGLRAAVSEHRAHRAQLVPGGE